jgi:hypothetical protein
MGTSSILLLMEVQKILQLQSADQTCKIAPLILQEHPLHFVESRMYTLPTQWLISTGYYWKTSFLLKTSVEDVDALLDDGYELGIIGYIQATKVRSQGFKSTIGLEFVRRTWLKEMG